ncbi:MAG: GNAT family N-acetyltransferase [Robiginitomaculum sp.]|nr:GNAT family N-acetyltransferase [Robiginitomaculum sp.]
MFGLLQFDQFEIRATSLGDLNYVCNLEAKPENAKFVDQWPLARHEEALASKQILHLVIVSAGGVLLGYVICEINKYKRCVKFQRIVVEKKGLGLGTKCLNALVEYFSDQKQFDYIYVYVREGVEGLINLYSNLGFSISIDEQLTKDHYTAMTMGLRN